MDVDIPPVGRLPLALNQLHNIVTCTDCHIGLPFDWVPAHMKDNHGLKCDEVQILLQLHIIERTMNAVEVKNWLDENKVLRSPVQGIPVWDGYGCSHCPYSAKKSKAIYNHVSTSHKEAAMRANVVERRVQGIFPSHLKKYVHIIDEGDQPEIPDWQDKLSTEFNQMMANLNTTMPTAGLDLRLMNTFIAKIRYYLSYLLY